jgi:hypothetical protein
MEDYLTHYYKRGTLPFRTLSGLSKAHALEIMEELSDDSILFSRFNEPIQYMEDRLEIEEWLRVKFIEKGGVPQDSYPLYAVLGRSDGIEQYSSQYDIEQIRLPISLFDEKDISFTVPDSMASFGFAKAKPKEFYIPEFHGQVFTLSEIKNFSRAELEEVLKRLSDNTIPYVEVQIWNHKIPMTYIVDTKD